MSGRCPPGNERETRPNSAVRTFAGMAPPDIPAAKRSEGSFLLAAANDDPNRIYPRM